ncbi:MAG: hypothetical protein PF961_23300 [Planctomycetota bacterium]|jgi:hypothetical protein|nr:hypothetical protein [Planctomycetota bacterium]
MTETSIPFPSGFSRGLFIASLGWCTLASSFLLLTDASLAWPGGCFAAAVLLNLLAWHFSRFEMIEMSAGQITIRGLLSKEQVPISEIKEIIEQGVILKRGKQIKFPARISSEVACRLRSYSA